MTQLSVHHPAVKHAAKWLRDNIELSPNEIIDERFELEFNCCIRRRPATDRFGDNFPVTVEFDDDAAAMMFVLKWS